MDGYKKVDEKTTKKINNLTQWVFGMNAFDFEDLVNYLTENGEFNYDESSFWFKEEDQGVVQEAQEEEDQEVVQDQKRKIK